MTTARPAWCRNSPGPVRSLRAWPPKISPSSAARSPPEARLRALLPLGLREWTGAEVIAGRFAGWFGDTEDFDLVEATVGEVGGRLHLHWRLRLRAERLGAGWFTVEQQAYADTDEGGRIAQLDLLCTGYRPEGDDA
jgi:fermentation-respiration switch protein FrsA (DUF1100 family)